MSPSVKVKMELKNKQTLKTEREFCNEGELGRGRGGTTGGRLVLWSAEDLKMELVSK